MRALLRLTLVLLAFAAAAFPLRPASAQEEKAPPPTEAAPSKDEQIRRVRELPADEKRRLFEALQRFRAMPPEKREALRRKAREVGTERLGELAGRDFDALRRRHDDLRVEMDEIEKQLGEGRLALLSPDERAWVRFNALRGFRNHCRIRLLEEAGLAQGFEPALPEEKRARIAKGVQAALAKMLAEKPASEQRRILALPPSERAVVRAALMREWRLRQVLDFVKRFEQMRLLRLLGMTPQERAAEIAKWKERVRWFEVADLLRKDGLAPDALRMLGQLVPDDRALVLQLHTEMKDLPVEERRAKIDVKIRELYGADALDPERTRRPFPRVRELLRERAGRRSPPTDPAQTPR